MSLPQAILDRFQKCIDRLEDMKDNPVYSAWVTQIDIRIAYYQNLIDEHS